MRDIFAIKAAVLAWHAAEGHWTMPLSTVAPLEDPDAFPLAPLPTGVPLIPDEAPLLPADDPLGEPVPLPEAPVSGITPLRPDGLPVVVGVPEVPLPL